MNLAVRRYVSRIQSVQSFLQANASSFVGVARVAQLQTQLGATLATMQALAEQQSSDEGDVGSTVRIKSALLEAVVDDLRLMARTARAMAVETPGTEDRFRLPRSNGEDAILSTARQFATDAAPLATQFQSYGLPADFLSDLQGDVAAYEELQTQKQTKVQSRVDAVSSLDETIAQSSRIVDTLNAIVRNVLRDDSSKLAAWRTATHLDSLRAHREPSKAKAAREAKAASTSSQA